MIKYLDFKSKKQFFRSEIYPALFKAGLIKKAKKIAECGSFIDMAVCTDCYSPHFNGAFSCKDKFCPICQKKRSLLWLTKVIPICDGLLTRGYKLYMLTYTVRYNKNQSLKECLDILNCAFRYMLHDDKTSRQTFNSLILGGVRSLEVKIGEDKETKQLTDIWHPHLHILVCVSTNMRFKELHKILYDMWNKCLNVVCKSKNLKLGTCNIKSIKAGKSKQYLLDQLCEVFKYMTKFDWQNSDKVYELITTMDRVKMQIAFGNFKSLLNEQQIDFEMSKSVTDIVNDFECAVCGSKNFAFTSIPYSNNIDLYDLKTKYSDLKTDDLILKEYMEINNDR